MLLTKPATGLARVLTNSDAFLREKRLSLATPTSDAPADRDPLPHPPTSCVDEREGRRRGKLEEERSGGGGCGHALGGGGGREGEEGEEKREGQRWGKLGEERAGGGAVTLGRGERELKRRGREEGERERRRRERQEQQEEEGADMQAWVRGRRGLVADTDLRARFAALSPDDAGAASQAHESEEEAVVPEEKGQEQGAEGQVQGEGDGDEVGGQEGGAESGRREVEEQPHWVERDAPRRGFARYTDVC
jgi:hypothetical protein